MPEGGSAQRRFLAAIFGAILALTPLTPSSGGGPELAYTPHAPIRILSDAEFTPANGVVRGTGTQEDPYLIAGWDILVTSPTRPGIQIANVQSYFFIADNLIHSTGFSIGIELHDASTTGIIRNNTITHVSLALWMLDSLPQVYGNRFISNYYGTFVGGGAIAMSGAAPIRWNGIQNNTFIDNRPWAVFRGYNVFPYSSWSAPIDASNNYWGSSTPPLPAVFLGDGTFPPTVDQAPLNNYVTPTVITAPWLTEEPIGRSRGTRAPSPTGPTRSRRASPTAGTGARP